MPDETINIYGQYAWHTDAKIVANIAGLLVLKEAINKAIVGGYDGIIDEIEVFASDGEGYKLKIICTDEWKKWQPQYGIVMEDD